MTKTRDKQDETNSGFFSRLGSTREKGEGEVEEGRRRGGVIFISLSSSFCLHFHMMKTKRNIKDK